MERLLQFFAYGHLPEHLQKVSKPFGDMAIELMKVLPLNAESTTAMRKLLEAKDCAVRAVLYKDEKMELPKALQTDPVSTLNSLAEKE